jgi:hypothetical protein
MSHHDRDLVARWLRRRPEEDIVGFNKDTYGDRIEAGAPNQTIEDAVNRIMDEGLYQLKLVGRDYEVVPTSASAGAGTISTAPRAATLTPNANTPAIMPATAVASATTTVAATITLINNEGFPTTEYDGESHTIASFQALQARKKASPPGPSRIVHDKYRAR